jgi:DNA-binding transcriptional LysR family regulator
MKAPAMPHPFDPILLRSFIAVVEEGGFTRAAARLNLGQPTVSHHVRRLEEAAGRRLLNRDTHSLETTVDGDAMLGFARRILDADAQARGYFTGARTRERLRFGASEDFVLSGLPDLLRDFVRGHPLVDLELTVGLSETLYETLDHGALDLIFCKRREGDGRGRSVLRDDLAWVGAGQAFDPSQPVPLVLYPPPSVTREIAIATLDQAGRSWRIACTSGSLSGLGAAVFAGLGVMPHSRRLMPRGLTDVSAASGLPALGQVEFVVVGSARVLRGPAAALADALVESRGRLTRMRLMAAANVAGGA